MIKLIVAAANFLALAACSTYIPPGKHPGLVQNFAIVDLSCEFHTVTITSMRPHRIAWTLCNNGEKRIVEKIPPGKFVVRQVVTQSFDPYCVQQCISRTVYATSPAEPSDAPPPWVRTYISR